MKIVVDTNVLISGVFFGGFPQKVLRAIIDKKVTACASAAMVSNLLVVLCENKDAQPVVNSGSLY